MYWLPGRTERGGSTWAVIAVIVLLVVAVLVAVLITVFLPTLQRLYSLGRITTIREAIHDDYSRFERREPIPEGLLFKQRGPAYQVANQIREMLRAMEKHARKFDEAIDWNGFTDIPYKRASVSTPLAYQEARSELQKGLNAEKEYFQNYFAEVDKFSKLIQSAAGNDATALEIAERELRLFKTHRHYWGQFLGRLEQWTQLALKRLDLIWRHRRHAIPDSSGRVVLAPGAGNAALSALERLDQDLSRAYDAVSEVWDKMNMPR
ncbi:MAG: hypothetical protein K6T17_06755 [Fimbriimonadales bacterium]|nr:hypothetical protein [Fimbriimonadales bacterium]